MFSLCVHNCLMLNSLSINDLTRGFKIFRNNGEAKETRGVEGAVRKKKER